MFLLSIFTVHDKKIMHVQVAITTFIYIHTHKNNSFYTR